MGKFNKLKTFPLGDQIISKGLFIECFNYVEEYGNLKFLIGGFGEKGAERGLSCPPIFLSLKKRTETLICVLMNPLSIF